MIKDGSYLAAYMPNQQQKREGLKPLMELVSVYIFFLYNKHTTSI